MLLVILLALILAVQAESGPWDKYERQPQEGDTATNAKTGERIILRDGVWRPILGPGPHTLVVSDGAAMTRMEYRTGPLCERARNAIERQVANPADTPNVIHGPPRTKAFCVPR